MSEETTERPTELERKKVKRTIERAVEDLMKWFKPMIREAVLIARSTTYHKRPWEEGASEREIMKAILKESVSTWHQDLQEHSEGFRRKDTTEEAVLELLKIVRRLKPAWAKKEDWYFAELQASIEEKTRGNHPPTAA